MTPLRSVALYGLTFLVFLAVDLLWLGFVAREFYARQLAALMRSDVRWGAAFLFYLIYVVGVLLLAVAPGLEAESLRKAVGLGAVLGIVAYAAYDLTNLAVMEGFPGRMVVVDLVWGTLLTASVAGVGYGLGRWLMP